MAESGFRVKKIKLLSPGIRAVLKSPEVMDELKRVAATQGEIEKEYIGAKRGQVIVKRDKQK